MSRLWSNCAEAEYCGNIAEIRKLVICCPEGEFNSFWLAIILQLTSAAVFFWLALPLISPEILSESIYFSS